MLYIEMKCRILYILLFLFLSIGYVLGYEPSDLAVNAKRKDKKPGLTVWGKKNQYAEHYVSLWTSAGYSCFFPQVANSKLKGLVGSTIGVGYERLGYNRDFLLTVGLELQFISSSMSMVGYKFDQTIGDTEGDETLCHYDIHDWQEYQYGLQAGLPVMVGYKHNHFYFLVGPKMTVGVWGAGEGKMSYETSATYPRYFDDFYDMQNHFYRNYTRSSKEPMSYGFGVSGCFEIGYEILNRTFDATSRKERYHWRKDYKVKLSFYAEYGALNVNSTKTLGDIVWFENDNAIGLNIRPYYTTGTALGAAINTFYTGVKVTVLLGEFCKNCQRNRVK